MNMNRLLGISSSSSSTAGADIGGDELNEDEILWTNDVTEQDERSFLTTTTPPSSINNRRPIFTCKSGILAALPETKQCEVLYRKPIMPATAKLGTSVPRQRLQERESLPGSRKLLQQQSAPVNVPLLSIVAARERNKKFLEVDYDEEGDDHEMLPPHEIVARGSGVSPKTTFSMLEGTGRTLKGRDLRQVRNAVWRKTGFLD